MTTDQTNLPAVSTCGCALDPQACECAECRCGGCGCTCGSDGDSGMQYSRTRCTFEYN